MANLPEIRPTAGKPNKEIYNPSAVLELPFSVENLEIPLYSKLCRAHEVWPKDGDFGKTAWSYFTFNEANEKYAAIERSHEGAKCDCIHQQEGRTV